MFGTSRAELAAALTGTYGGFRVVGHTNRPGNLGSGDAWPLLAAVERGPGQAFEVTWHLIVVLGSDEVTAANQIDASLAPLMAAIEDSGVAFVDGATVPVVSTSGGDLFAIQINVRSE